MVLTPEQRTLRAKQAGHKLHATHDSDEIAANARAKSPASPDYFERQVDPDGTLPPADRAARADHARKAYFAGLALKSSKARAARTARKDARP